MLTFYWESHPRETGVKGKGSERGKDGEHHELAIVVTSTGDSSVLQDIFREAGGSYCISKQSRGGREKN